MQSKANGLSSFYTSIFWLYFPNRIVEWDLFTFTFVSLKEEGSEGRCTNSTQRVFPAPNHGSLIRNHMVSEIKLGKINIVLHIKHLLQPFEPVSLYLKKVWINRSQRYGLLAKCLHCMHETWVPFQHHKIIIKNWYFRQFRVIFIKHFLMAALRMGPTIIQIVVFV